MSKAACANAARIDPPLMPEALALMSTRWGLTYAQLGTLLGITPEAVDRAIATGEEPAGVTFQGALLIGALFFVLQEEAGKRGSDAAVAAWLDAPIGDEGRRRADCLAHVRSVQEIGACL